MIGCDCVSKGDLFGLADNGKRVSFTENVFYQFISGNEQAAIKAQLYALLATSRDGRMSTPNTIRTKALEIAFLDEARQWGGRHPGAWLPL